MYYSMLPVDQQEATVEVDSPELGHTLYNFTLSALPPPVEKEVKFVAQLGKSVTQTIELENLSNKPKIEYLINVRTIEM